MGLDVSHDCWHGAYSAFTRWRNVVSEAGNYTLVKDGYYTVPDLDWTAFTEGNLLGEWDELPEDPLVVLIVHSDCDGELPVAILTPLADRLESLLPKLPGEESDLGHIRGGYQAMTKLFIAGLRLAASLNEPVEFH